MAVLSTIANDIELRAIRSVTLGRVRGLLPVSSVIIYICFICSMSDLIRAASSKIHCSVNTEETYHNEGKYT
ncbi:hypothetical protein prwr041_03870 [Prevotella herbatica]|uniref:Uncharacterized protein n=1 Tax=Prevotella herbatica TaxID=2801997 RepID=A0ABM7NVG1_9BACT|nr:hypothetical protein prwr041_03870 [Prevotella herbatica]